MGALRIGSDPVNNVSPEMNKAGQQWASRYEDVMLLGTNMWLKIQEISKAAGEKSPTRIYFIGVPGNSGEDVADALLETLGYVPSPDGTMYVHRKPGGEYPKIRYSLWNTDKMVGEKSKIDPIDLFLEDEEKYRDLETETLKEFAKAESSGYPMGIICGDGAVLREENVKIMKTGLVVWLDVDPRYSWTMTQSKPSPGGGIYVPPEFKDRPPVWALAKGWDGDPDDTEGMEEYCEIVSSRRELYEPIADIRLRTDIPGIADNAYWGAEKLLKAMKEKFGLASGEVTMSQEIMEKDLEKFLEGARLSKYLSVAKTWCETEGAASIEDIVENIPEFAEALKLKPLERKRLSKAAAAVAA